MGQEAGNNNTNTTGDKKRGVDPSIWIALIGAIVTITGMLLSFPPVIDYFTPKPTLTPLPAITATFIPEPSNTIFATESSTSETMIADTPTPGILPSNTIAPDLSSPTLSVASEMFVRIAASQTSGKAPLTVKFDARDSYVQAPDGTIFECSRGACRYSWYILLNGQEFDRPDTDRGTLDFRFQQEGIYSISVYICHGSDSPTCGNGATLVIVD